MPYGFVVPVLATSLSVWAPGPNGSVVPPGESVPARVLLKVGDPAPPLRVERFLKGEPIPAFEKGRVYVVEFWATWCGPCIQAMPHLSALQAEYRDRGVTIIGTNIQELRRTPEGGYEDWFGDESRAHVEKFVSAQGDRMAYTVALDGEARAMDRGWMKASGTEGIPASFIVDREGTIAWIGHPTVLRMPLHEIAEGTWDLANGPGRVKQAEQSYIGAMQLFATDAKKGLEQWERAEKDYPVLSRDLIGPKFKALMAANQCDAAYAVAAVIVEDAVKRHDASELNGIAWSIVDPRATLSTRDLDLALRAATHANRLTGDKDPSMLDTLARTHFARGEIDRAIEIQTQAVELASEPLKSSLTPSLDEYKKAKPR